MARGVPRSEIFVTTKLWPQFYAGSAPAEQVPVWLEELGLEYIDLVLLHHPEGMPFGKCPSGTPAECRASAWSQLSALQKTGVVRDLGVSNFNIRQINELGSSVAGGAPVAVNQIQYNAFAPPRQDLLVEECLAQGVAVTAWSSFQGTMMQVRRPLDVPCRQRGVYLDGRACCMLFVLASALASCLLLLDNFSVEQ